jgi:hypothetical protein
MLNSDINYLFCNEGNITLENAKNTTYNSGCTAELSLP